MPISTEHLKICAVVVTYNRKDVLIKCVEALTSQTRTPDLIIVVDNGSTDGTKELVENISRSVSFMDYLNLGANLGGAGGFHYGMRHAYENGYDWMWIMDDDCLPSRDCLENLFAGIDDPDQVYSPVVLSVEDGRTVLWGIKVQVGTGTHEVGTLPFNGFMIHRRSVEQMGFPEKGFFIYGDDTEYNLRARAHGKKVIMVTGAVMYHPHKNRAGGLKVYKMFLNRLWTYFKLRNAVIIYKKYGYISLNQVVMFITALCFYILQLKFEFIRLWLEALIDGLRNRLYARDLTP